MQKKLSFTVKEISKQIQNIAYTNGMKLAPKEIYFSATLITNSFQCEKNLQHIVLTPIPYVVHPQYISQFLMTPTIHEKRWKNIIRFLHSHKRNTIDNKISTEILPPPSCVYKFDENIPIKINCVELSNIERYSLEYIDDADNSKFISIRTCKVNKNIFSRYAQASSNC